MHYHIYWNKRCDVTDKRILQGAAPAASKPKGPFSSGIDDRLMKSL
jgi:hypothetical protein